MTDDELLESLEIVDDPDLVPGDEWDADRAFAFTGDADDYSYLDVDVDEDA